MRKAGVAVLLLALALLWLADTPHQSQVGSQEGLASVPTKPGVGLAGISTSPTPAPLLPGQVQAQPIGPVEPLEPLPELSSAIPAFSSLQPSFRGVSVLSEAQMRAVLWTAGVPVEWHAEFLAIATCESQRRPKAIGDGGMSLGLLQLWRGWAAWFGVRVEELFDPVINARVARAVREYRGRFGGAGGWSCADLLGIP